jgi:hypothetical protein
LVPRTSRRPINIAIQNAGRLIIPPWDGVEVIEAGRFIPPCCKILVRYPDQPAATVEDATVYSSANPHATIHAINSPRMA